MSNFGDTFLKRLIDTGKGHLLYSEPSIDGDVDKFSAALNLDMEMYDEWSYSRGAMSTDALESLQLGKIHCEHLIDALMKKIHRDHCL